MMRSTIGLVAAVAALACGGHALAQAAGAGADYNRAEAQRMQAQAQREAARQAESRRLEQIDKPLRNDVVGNALTGGAVTGVIRGAAAGVVNVVTSTARGAAVEAYKTSGGSNAASSDSTPASEGSGERLP